MAAIVGAVLSISMFTALPAAISPACADTVTAGDGATATVADIVAGGSAIHIEGTGWTHPTNGTGSTIGVKLGDAVTTEPASGPVINPATGTSADEFDVWDAVEAEDDGTFSADIPFPTATNTNPALASPWAVGTTHTLRLLTGSMESGDTPRSVLLTFTIGEGLVSTATTATDDKVTVTFSGGTFPAGEVLSVKHDSTPLQWSVKNGRQTELKDTITAGSTGTISASVVLAAGVAPAGPLTLTITGDQGTDEDVTVVVPPSVSFGGGTSLGATGTLTLGNLVAGATISSVQLGDQTLATNLAANGEGKATASYTIPRSMSPITQSLVITQATPEARTYTLSQAVYPDESTVGAGRFDVISSTAAFYQGFYQSAYSATEDALYVTASDRGTGNAGFIYKLDPDTLAIEASKETVNPDFAKAGAFGIGVDDVHGNVWVSNTGSNSVAVYKESDLSLVKQFPAETISHSRDVVYDPTTELVFVSSASEGSSASSLGYISVFEADDKNGNGTPYEKLTDIQTGTRDVFNPVSLTLGDGKLFSPSLGSNKVVSIDTAHVLDVGYAPTFLEIDGIDVGGRGASGIAYDVADDRLFIASQNSNEVVVADATTGATIKEVPTGRQALNVVFDPVHRLAYVANFGGTSVSVLDADGDEIASLPIATANHISIDDRGDAFVVDKAATNRVWKITPRLETVGGVDVLDPTAGSVTGNAATTPLSVTVIEGRPIHIEGTNFRTADGTAGSKIAVKSASVPGSPTIAEFEADAQGNWSADVPFPNGWEAGDGQHLRLLTGSLKGGDTVRSIAVKVQVEPTAAETPVEPPVTTEPGPTPTPDSTVTEKIAKATQLVSSDKQAIVKIEKAVTKATVKVTKVKKQVIAARKAAKNGSRAEQAAAAKKVKRLEKKLQGLRKELKGLKSKQAGAKKKLAKDQEALVGLK
ncbi:MAG: hypothetical protein BGO11_02675 [Solirubrobacterales bacterium 70-9]|nr:MAG: hypothetical protein BGO11_02675 [Solirubrobacterales bacterium 70-9]